MTIKKLLLRLVFLRYYSILFCPLFVCSLLSGCHLPEISFELFQARETQRIINFADATHATSYPISVDSTVQAGETAKEFLSFGAHSGPINAIVVNREGTLAYSGGDDGRVVRASLPANKNDALQSNENVVIETILESSKPILALALSPDESMLAIAQTNSVIVADLKQKKFPHHLTRLKGRFTSLAWDPRGQLIFIGLTNGDINVWSLEDGFFTRGGKNSFDDVESYSGGVSKIVSLLPHPRGGVFFSAEELGVISIWRLIRTERELGLRDTFNVDDQDTLISNRRVIANLASRVEQIWLDESATMLYAACSDGKIRSWKIRGLDDIDSFSVGKSELFGVTGLRLPDSARPIQILAAANRQGQVTFLCRAASDSVRPEPAQLMSIGQTDALSQTVSKITSGVRSPFLWGVEKADSIILFDLHRLSSDEALLKKCLL
jgi:WD40 repeat protein